MFHICPENTFEFAGGKIEAGIDEGASDPVFALADRRFWQAYDVQTRQTTRLVDFHYNRRSVNTCLCAAEYPGEHARETPG